MRLTNPCSQLAAAPAVVMFLVAWGGCARDEPLEPVTTTSEAAELLVDVLEPRVAGCEADVTLEPCLDGELYEPRVAQCAACVVTPNTTSNAARVIRYYEPDPTVCQPRAQAIFAFDTAVTAGREIECVRITFYIPEIRVIDGHCIDVHKISIYSRQLPQCPATLGPDDWVGCGSPATFLGEFPVLPVGAAPYFKTLTLPASAINQGGITEFVLKDSSLYAVPPEPCFPGAFVYVATGENPDEDVRPKLAIDLAPFYPCIDGELAHNVTPRVQTPCNDCVFNVNASSKFAKVARDGDESLSCAERQAVFAFDTSPIPENLTITRATLSFTVNEVTTLGWTGYHLIHVYGRLLPACPPAVLPADWVREPCGPPAVLIGQAIIGGPGRYTAPLAYPDQMVNKLGTTQLVLANASPFLEEPEAAIIADIVTVEGAEGLRPELDVEVEPLLRDVREKVRVNELETAIETVFR